MSRVLMKLGPVKFEILKTAYKELEDSINFRWTENKRYRNSSTLHYGGEDLEIKTLNGEIHTLLSGKKGLNLYDKLKREAAKGEPLILVDALGKNWGKWAILSLNKKETEITEDSLPLKIKFNIKLKAYR